MLPHRSQCTESPPPMKNYLAPNVLGANTSGLEQAEKKPFSKVGGGGLGPGKDTEKRQIE